MYIAFYRPFDGLSKSIRCQYNANIFEQKVQSEGQVIKDAEITTFVIPCFFCYAAENESDKKLVNRIKSKTSTV